MSESTPSSKERLVKLFLSATALSLLLFMFVYTGNSTSGLSISESLGPAGGLYAVVLASVTVLLGAVVWLIYYKN
ncbi:MAG: hypothetical protein QF775_03705 [archaeon]|jgi:hypothetical protein|nr:hypothetical protein [Euryarchaeota archaeon]MDP6704564.1 hypothetical protein [archaeon]MDP7260603.1 hypothetical protein [archaeon]|tara:strand:+ start:19893 stop:20117 length:225 start_codon:yes stop_codon:yes gene_type:complete